MFKGGEETSFMYVIWREFNLRELSILFTFNAAVHLLQNKVLV